MEFVQGPGINFNEQLERMVLQYEKDLLRIAYIYLRDADLAQDAVQETFLRAYQNIHGFRADCSEKTWLMRIAMNVCKDIRKSAWFRFVDQRVSLEHLAISTALPSLEQIALMSEIMRLPRKHMEVILLYYYQDLNTREIAKVLNITPSAVSDRLNKARRRLCVSLRGDDINEK